MCESLAWLLSLANQAVVKATAKYNTMRVTGDPSSGGSTPAQDIPSESDGEKAPRGSHSHLENTALEHDPGELNDVHNKLTKETILACIVCPYRPAKKLPSNGVLICNVLGYCRSNQCVCYEPVDSIDDVVVYKSGAWAEPLLLLDHHRLATGWLYHRFHQWSPVRYLRSSVFHDYGCFDIDSRVPRWCERQEYRYDDRERNSFRNRLRIPRNGLCLHSRNAT